QRPDVLLFVHRQFKVTGQQLRRAMRMRPPQLRSINDPFAIQRRHVTLLQNLQWNGLILDKQGGSGNSLACSQDRKSTRLNSSHVKISYAVFCLKKKS